MSTVPEERPLQEPGCSSTDKERLAALRRYEILDTPPDRDFDDLCHLAAHICGAPVATIGFIDADRQWFKSVVGLEITEIPLEASLCCYTICEEEILMVEDLLKDDRFRTMSCCEEPLNFRFYAGVVIRSSDGLPLGTVAVADRVSRKLDEATVVAFKTVARQVSSLLESRRFERRLEEKNRLAELRASLSARLAQSEPLANSLQACAEILGLYFQGAVVRIWMLDADGEELVAIGTAGLGPVREGTGKLPVAKSRAGQIYLSRQSQTLHLEGSQETAWEPPPVSGLVFFAGYPLIARGQTLGVLTVDFREVPASALLKEFDLLAYLIAQGIENKRAEEDLMNRERIARFLAKASSDLAEVGDFYSTMQKIANSAVPEFSDWCLIFLTTPEVPLKGIAIAHQVPEEIVKMRDMIERYTPRLAATSGVEETGESELFEVIPDSLLQKIADDEAHLQALRSLELISSISVALTRRGEIFGMMTFYTAESGRRFDRHHLAAAEDLARRAEVAIENANLYQQLQEADRSKDEFLATLAHELRNPLAPLSNAVEILKTELDPETHRQTCEMMARQLRHLVRLVDDLLDISRITHNRLELRREKIAFSEIAKNVLETATPLVEAAHHRLLVDVPEEPIILNVDPARITQVISNLVNNAVKYTREGGEIAFRAWREGSSLCVCVKDSGVGIEAQMLPRVFDLFAQVRGSLENARGGMGIGLTLVRRLTELHGGSVEAFSEGRGKGSEFLVRLPIVREEELKDDSSRAEAKEAPQRTFKILVVDDNRDSAITLARLLARLGHELQTAYDGPEAVTLAAEFEPDVVFLDIGMPNLNGYDAARLIRKEAEARGRSIVLMAMTGWGQESDLRRAKEAGFDQHLLKPLDFNDVKRRLLALG